MGAYLFVHFKEKRTPDGEQVYFGVSQDGYHWEEVNNGHPVLWSYFGDKGVRDHTIIRTENNEFIIMATDLSLSYGMLNQYNDSWAEIGRNGSKSLVLWRSKDLINWERQELIKLGDKELGCLWAPDIIYDSIEKDYIIHWSSSYSRNNFTNKAIFYSRTIDFHSFTKPEILYNKEDSGVIDSAMYEEDGLYYLFVKSEGAPDNIILLTSKHITGPFKRMENFDQSMAHLESGVYEAPTAVKADDGRWCLFLDYYGTGAEGQGYVPFIADKLASAHFIRSESSFSFPYGFKHGTILNITNEEYKRLKNYHKKPSEY
ncbi:glycoside hydrolase family 43 protein [Alkalihalobacillus trypoxylicola]|uniref:1,4-beta-xylanase n=1 Tax=Alkalihalobacillus trypoxylicola TaxID=519424 RepID=A0A162CMU2_9BACI|nr:glycoside hydrolase family 43 protein [Alkalihalobacillus trypoxylicola]KYG25598.1 1,4-beta-xylanase [Alkalihalobacillus trypoxylicola]